MPRHALLQRATGRGGGTGTIVGRSADDDGWGVGPTTTGGGAGTMFGCVVAVDVLPGTGVATGGAATPDPPLPGWAVAGCAAGGFECPPVECRRG